MGDRMPLKVTMRRADHHDMSDLSRLLDDVYSNGPAKPAAQQPPAPAPAPAPPAAPAAPPVQAAAPAPEPDLPWESATTMDEAFADWVPGPDADAPQAERDLFELADDEVVAPADRPSVLEHVFAADEPTEAVDALGDLFADEVEPPFQAAAPPAAIVPPAPVEPIAAPVAPAAVAPVPMPPAPAPAPVPVAEAVDAFADVLADEPLSAPVAPAASGPFSHVIAQQQAAPVATSVKPLAYEPPATLAEALLDAPDAPPADLVTEVDEPWPLAGLAPIAPHHDGDVQHGGLVTSWRREHDDLLPARGRRR